MVQALADVEKARLALLVVRAAGGPGARGPSVQTATYATLRRGQGSGRDRPGWVPRSLPEGRLRAACRLRRRTAASDGACSTSATADADALRGVLQPEEISFAGTVMEIPGRIEWWPVILRGRLDAERIQTTGLRAYPARSGGPGVRGELEPGTGVFLESVTGGWCRGLESNQ